jgi:hypothetical protein
MANKLPEYLASGVPLFVVGPGDIAVLQYLEEINCGVRVVEKKSEAVETALRTLIESPDRQLQLAQHAQRLAFERHNIHQVRRKFTELLSDAAMSDGVTPVERPHESTVAPAALLKILPVPFTTKEATAATTAKFFAGDTLRTGKMLQGLRHYWRHNPAFFLSVTALPIAAGPFFLKAVWPFRIELWIVAALFAAFGVGGFLLRQTLRRKLAKLEERLVSQHISQIEKRVGKFSESEKRLASQHTTHKKNLTETFAESQERLENQQAIHVKQVSEELTEFEERLINMHAAQMKAAADKLAKFQDELDAVKSQSLALDIVAALRILSPLESGEQAVEVLKRQPEIEHGHALLMAILADESHDHPSIFAKSCLIEIGTTRERSLGQGSTEKLAIFTALLGMQFITVDVDPINTKRAEKTLRYLNPAAKAVTERGENYLKLHQEPLDFVYLDAFDFDHGKHSQTRQDRYRQLLQTEINDEACWTMHEACARAIIARMREGGIVVLDDTWTDANGEYTGKGKLAVPLLVANGFEIITKTRMTVALRRTTPSGVANFQHRS